MKRVIIESPYGSADASTIKCNLRYLRACMRDCIVNHNEAPFASHGLYTQPGVLCDEDEAERDLGIEAGFAWRTSAEMTVVYIDLGTTNGMRHGIKNAKKMRQLIEFRNLGSDWETKAIENEKTRPGKGWGQ